MAEDSDSTRHDLEARIKRLEEERKAIELPLIGIRETIEARVERLEDKYIELKDQVAKMDKDLTILLSGQNIEIAKLGTKMNFIQGFSVLTAGSAITVLIAVLFHI